MKAAATATVDGNAVELASGHRGLTAELIISFAARELCPRVGALNPQYRLSFDGSFRSPDGLLCGDGVRPDLGSASGLASRCSAQDCFEEPLSRLGRIVLGIGSEHCLGWSFLQR